MGLNYQPQLVSWISSISSISPVSPGHVLKGEAMYHSSPTKHTALHRLSPPQLRRSIPKPGFRMIPLPLFRKTSSQKINTKKTSELWEFKKKKHQQPSSDQKKSLKKNSAALRTNTFWWDGGRRSWMLHLREQMVHIFDMDSAKNR